MKIILDAMGGDSSPGSNVKGAILATKEMDIEILLLGDELIIRSLIKEFGEEDNEQIKIIHCSETISMEEKPVKAIRTKKDSSLSKGLSMLKKREADAFVSAGSTGAILAGGLFIVGRIKGIDRPALAGIYPTQNGGSVLMDIGANSDCKPKNLLEFGMLGSIYASNVLKKTDPKVALVNIGTEEEKGNELYKEAHSLIKSKNQYSFIGNIEAREIPSGQADVMICDGFTGNIILKLTEGVAKTIFSSIKTTMSTSIWKKMVGLILKRSLKNLKKSLDSDEHGGAPLLGVDGIIIKAHGSSNEKAIKNALKQAKIFYDSNSLEKIREYANNTMN